MNAEDISLEPSTDQPSEDAPPEDTIPEEVPENEAEEEMLPEPEEGPENEAEEEMLPEPLEQERPPVVVHEDKSTQIFEEIPKHKDRRIHIVEDGFGVVQGPDQTHIIRRYTLCNSNGFRVQIINYGAIVTSIKCPDKVGRTHDVLLGFDDIQGYIEYQRAYHGAIIGRVANRVDRGRFKICKREYELTKNVDGQYHLHGGLKGFDQVFWASYADKDNGRVIMTYLSKDGEEGYPGDLMTSVTYSLYENNELKIEMKALSNQPTPVNLTSHLYFNLAGHCAGPNALKDHYLTVNADKFLVTREDLIPTGGVRNVGGTIYDLRAPRLLRLVIPEVPGGGYDTSFCINGKKEDGIRLNARLRHPASGRVLEVFSDQPSLQVYTANFLPNPEDAPVATSDYQIEERPLGSAHVKTPETSSKMLRELLPPYRFSVSRDDTQQYQRSLLDSQLNFPGPAADRKPLLEDVEEEADRMRQDMYDTLRTKQFSEQRVSDSKRTSKLPLSPTGSMETAPLVLSPAQASAVVGEEKKPDLETFSTSSVTSTTAAESTEPEVSDITSSVSEGSQGPLVEMSEKKEKPPLFVEMRAKDRVLYYRHGAICLETQNYPDAVNHRRFPDMILRPGEIYSHTCIYRFGIQER